MIISCKHFRYLLWILLIVIISACVPSKPVYEEKILPADRLIKKIEANRRKVKSFKGTGKLIVESPALDASASFEVLLKKPDSIKVSIYGPFGIELAQSIVTKNHFKFYDAIRNDLYIGGADSDILKKIFKVDLSFYDLMDAFTGSVNLTDKLRNEPDRYEILNDGYVLTYVDSTLMRESVYTIMSKDLSIINYQIVEIPNNILFEGKYSNFIDYDSLPIPFTTVIDYYKKDQKLMIEYRNIDINLDLDNLVIKTPNDVNIIQW